MLLYAFILFVMLIIVIRWENKSGEHFAAVPNDEAIASISSLYNEQNMTVSNSHITKDLTVDGTVNVGNDLDVKGTIHTHDYYQSGTDFKMGTDKHSGRGDCGNCRALVHDSDNKLTINFSHDFGGGTTIGSSTHVEGDLSASGTIQLPVKHEKEISTNRAPLSTSLQCPSGQVMCGLRFEHGRDQPWWSERIYVQCCTPGKH